MDIYIDNDEIVATYGIGCLDWKPALSYAAERINERTWHDKSGVEKRITNMRYQPRDFVLQMYAKADNIGTVYTRIKTLIDYMFTKGAFVLSLRDTDESFREAFICGRTLTVVGDIHVREQNSLYVFKMAFKDVNPNALYYKTSIAYNTATSKYEASILYQKGKPALMLWGDGTQEIVTNSGTYFRNDFTEAGLLDVIIDIDKDSPNEAVLEANFTSTTPTGIVRHEVVFTDTSIGDVVLWSWDFGDGNTSAEQSPTHVYTVPGVYTVTLRVFNAIDGSSIMEKEDYVTVRAARLMINNTDSFLKNNTDYLIKN